MSHDRHITDETADWRTTIQDQLDEIDSWNELPAADKNRLKKFYFEHCLPPYIQDVVRKYFPQVFREAKILIWPRISSATDRHYWPDKIRELIEYIDSNEALTWDDKQVLKDYYYKNFFPRAVQRLARQEFPDDFTGGNE